MERREKRNTQGEELLARLKNLREKKEEVTYKEIQSYEKDARKANITHSNFFNNIHCNFPEGNSGIKTIENLRVVKAVIDGKIAMKKAVGIRDTSLEEKRSNFEKKIQSTENIHKLFYEIFSPEDCKKIQEGNEYKWDPVLHKKVYILYIELLKTGYTPEEITR